ncbi:MAG TPA: hypothetical protein PK605_02575 [Ignavibacteria bacterium]|nr:hypothetical protein [Bacteroidota bacterium]HRE12191.1 hypothetical protein [Ignavibacteria bacterium]HRF65817.1 hypothetical protein [Ignavibacteria bacterium]HRJ03267.1 hypothetical protein [Ignavibacteria bacterium]
MKKFIRVNTHDDIIIFDKLNFAGILANTETNNEFILIFFKDGNVYKRICSNNQSANIIGNLKADESFKEILNDNEIIMLNSNEGLFVKKYLKDNIEFCRVKDNAKYFTIGFINGEQFELHSTSSQAIGDLEKIYNEIIK